MTSITITRSAPAEPATVTEYGDALPELVRALNHVTRHPGALEVPADADRLIRNVYDAVSMLPQLLGHAARWLEAEQAAGRVAVTGGAFPGRPGTTVSVTCRWLDKAGAAITADVGRMLEAAAAGTACMTPAGDNDSSEGSRQ